MLTRLIFNLSLVLVLLCFFVSAAGFASAQNASPTGTTTTQITGVVLDAQRHPVGDAQVRLSGAISKTTATAGDGSFAFLNLPSGIFRLDITKAGFNAATQDDIVTAAGSTTSLSFTLQAASLTSLTVIGNVSVNARSGANAINTTPASIVDVPATTFTDQGQLEVNQVLNEEPGITIGLGTSSGPTIPIDGASPLATGVPSIRGGLPYETESLIDGHAISLGQYGYFSPSFISPYELQNVEIVKGPGATSPSINYAINGTINYRTLEPTVKPEFSADFGEDQYGGNFANLRATGTVGRLSYAFDYVTDGTQGFQRGFTGPTIVCQSTAAYLNGVSANLNGTLSFPHTVAPFNGTTFYGGLSNAVASMMVCCATTPMYSNERNELGKIRYAFTPSTALTVTWLGGQTTGAFKGGYLDTCVATTFAPPAGYTGSFPAGNVANAFLPADNGWLDRNNTNLFETEFHTPIGKTATLLLRQYSSSIQTFIGGPGNSGPTAGGPVSYTVAAYGGVDLNGSTTPTIFNGQVVTITENAYSEERSFNNLNGYTAEIDKQAGDDLLSLSYDEETTSTYAPACDNGRKTIEVPAGSSQSFQSVMGRAQFELGPRVNGTLSDNFGSYTDVYTQNGGASFVSSSHTYEAPRLSLTFRPNADESVRFSAGLSVAPPYIALLNNNEQVQVSAGAPPNIYYTESGNSGDVLPETAFGYDIGFDTRLHSPYTVLSVDGYQTILHNQFLLQTTQDGTYTCQRIGSAAYGFTAPLYVTQTANLGHSEYEGLELSLHRTPPTGWGYRIQGALIRAFVYDLPAGFYNTPSGPYTTNLGVIPNINFQTTGVGYNGMGSARVPYSTGYAELNYRGHNGASFLLGMTYYGSNNSYNLPAFEVVTASFTQPISKRASLQLSVYNLTNALPDLVFSWWGNPGTIFTPLANGQLGFSNGNIVGPSIARLTLHIDL